jgi:hypothetical protein
MVKNSELSPSGRETTGVASMAIGCVDTGFWALAVTAEAKTIARRRTKREKRNSIVYTSSDGWNPSRNPDALHAVFPRIQVMNYFFLINQIGQGVVYYSFLFFQ